MLSTQSGEDALLSKDVTVDLAGLLHAVTGGKPYHTGGPPLSEVLAYVPWG